MKTTTINGKTYATDWQGYEINVPRGEQCRRRDGNHRRYCDRAKGHTGNHRAGAVQWGAAR